MYPQVCGVLVGCVVHAAVNSSPNHARGFSRRSVKKAVSQLDNQELAQLAARADKAQHDFAAGYLSTLDIALIILGVALIILIIVVAK